MSDDESSISSSESVNLSTTGLIATRNKRSTAGNLYATLRANLDDEELQKDLLAEDEEDVGEYEGSDRQDDDDAMDSSSDEEDAGPAKEGDREDLEGEKELKRVERAETRKRKRMEEAKMRLPAWQKKKKVKLADDVKTEDEASARPKKKSERSNWLPDASDMPVRQSSRASAIANREVVHTNLKESALRSEKQKKVMAKHAERSQTKKRTDLTQEERLAKAVKIEKETSREFGRWEREEAERQRIREEQLAAKRNRGIDGPAIRHWSGSAMWEGDKLKIKRIQSSQKDDEIKEDIKDDVGQPTGGDATTNEAAAQTSAPTSAPDQTAVPAGINPQSLKADASFDLYPELQSLSADATQQIPVHPQRSLLDGIQEYAAEQSSSGSLPQSAAAPVPASAVPISFEQNPYVPSAPIINSTPGDTAQPLPLAPQPYSNLQANSTQPPSAYHVWPSGHQELSVQHPQISLPQLPPPPLVKEQARRSLIMLEQFDSLEPTQTKSRTSKASKDATIDPSPIALALLPSSYPPFIPEESRYLLGRMSKKKAENLLPPVPLKPVCALTSWPAKFRDPRSGLPYADLPQFRIIQRLLAGACSWSGLLGAWVGPEYRNMGRAASGVPEGFSTAPAPTLQGQHHEVGDANGGDIKMEDAG